ncbi:hypothetical protein MJH12_02825 [bacterium]|nr:hypothetical protein [bacterium]
MKTKISLAICALILSSNIQAENISYNEVKKRVRSNISSELVEREGMGAWNLLGVVTGLGKKLKNRVRGTLQEQTDFKDPKDKLLHPRGICAEATWNINERTGLTGLFEQGTNVPAIVRFSAGTSQSEYEDGKARLFGIAVKLFPSRYKKQKVKTANLFLMGKNGLSGADRPSFFYDRNNDVYFSNIIPEPEGFIFATIAKLFKQFDTPITVRPLWPLAEVNQQNQIVNHPNTPYRIFVRPQDFGANQDPALDFRKEIASYGAKMKFDLFVQELESSERQEKIGVLSIDTPFMSDTCNQELHFHHHPNIRN